MFNHLEYNTNETKNFITLTKEALKDAEIFEKWNGIRAMFGIYPERDKGTYMLRTRFPGGILSLDEFATFVDMCENYGDKRVHLTTRQGIQIHGLSFENLAKVLEMLETKGYSSRATGGNAPRAVITPPMSGFEEEILDVTAYSDAVTNHVLNNEGYLGLPRKYKISLSNNEKNSLYVKISDLGFLAVEVDGIKGFKVYGAGGLGAKAKEAIVLEDFIKKEELLYHVEAMKNLFTDHGDRNVKARARIRYIAERLGNAEFVTLYKTYLAEVYKTKKLDVIIENKKLELEEATEIKEIPNLLKSNIKGRYGYYFHPTNGNIPTKLGEKFVEELKKLPYQLQLRLTSSQGLVVRNIKGQDIRDLKDLLKNFGIKDLSKSIVCVGKTVCNLGILDTPKLLEGILKYFKNKQKLAKYLPTLRISGCPNSCGAQQVAELGFWGKKKNGEAYYTLVAGGNFQGETVVLNKNIGDIKATDIPQFLEELAIKIADSKTDYKKFIETNQNYLEDSIKNFSQE